MGTGQRLSLILAIVVLPACQAGAQTMPWPSEAPRAGAPAAPWPGAGGAPPTAAPMPGPMPGAGAPPGMGMGMGAPPPMGGAGTPPCMAEFTKLREDVQKQAMAAKAASEKKVSREEMCKHITAYSNAELKWVKFTEANVSSCGIPTQIAQQLKQVHANTEQTKGKVCAPAPAAAAPAAPSLSDALGTTRLPTPETTRTGSGTLDTLTGNAIQQR